MMTFLNRWSLLASALGLIVPAVFASDLHEKEQAAVARPGFVLVGDRVDESRAWLGIAPALVPAPVASQLGLSQGEGIMIGNVVLDSPAERAGLQQYDVLTRVNGETIGGDISDFIEIITDSPKGSTLNLTLFRNGHEIVLAATLGSRPEEIEWVYELAPESRLKEELKSSGHFLKRSPDGRWVFQNLGDIDLDGLPNQLKLAIPGATGQSFSFQLNNGDQHIEISSEQDGETIKVEQDGDGPITVTRTSKNDRGGDVTEETAYDTREQLAEEDPQASELFDRASLSRFHKFDADQLNDRLRDLSEKLSDRSEWSEEAQRRMAEALEAYEKAMEETNSRLQAFQQLMPQGQGLDWSGKYGIRFGNDPRYTFKVRPDGTIEAHVSRGGDKVIREYADEDDFAQRDPEGYQRYIEFNEPVE